MVNTPFNRRQFLYTAGGLLFVSTLPTVRCLSRPKSKKGINVLFLMTDQQHYQSLSLTGNPYIQTPNMDRIGREGVRFENATCVTPFCSPSRASILSGVYPHTHGVLNNTNRGQPMSKPYDSANTETILYKNGYATAQCGKWHIGNKGLFECYASGANTDKANSGYNEFLEKHLPSSKFSNHPSPARYRGRPVEMIPVIEKGYHEFHKIPNVRFPYISIIGRSVIPPDLLPETQTTNQVLDLIEKNASNNFMITASWSPPHDLWVMPEPYYSMVERSKIELSGSLNMPIWDRGDTSKRLGEIMGSEGIREYVAIYHSMVKYIDDQTGRILNKLNELGLAEDTLVIFTSDHGDMVGAHGCIGKSIGSYYDDLISIPLLMRLPGRIKPGTIVKQPVSQIDFMPTILDYLSLPAPKNIHGCSMRPLIEGLKVDWRDYAFCQRGNGSRMLRTERYKFTYGTKNRMVALYDLKNDPHEDHNLAEDPAYIKVVREMHERLLKIMADDGDPARVRFTVNPLTLIG